MSVFCHIYKFFQNKSLIQITLIINKILREIKTLRNPLKSQLEVKETLLF